MRLTERTLLLCCAGAYLLLPTACRREQRRFSEPPEASRLETKGATRAKLSSTDGAALERYAANAWAISEGQRLYGQMNCSGCHGPGGGGAMGPPLMDAKWRYGGGLADIERSIVGGRPNGMPAFGELLSPQQVWQLVGYVRAFSGHAPSDSAPVRSDHMAVRPPPSRTTRQPMVTEKVD
jgi:cytochrome c oxidase cbb3-type subunit 3